MPQTGYIHSVWQLVRQHRRFFLLTALAALALRSFFLIFFPAITSDSRIYADIARNWLYHGIYALTDKGIIVPTCIRLPGYPAVLAATFAIFGGRSYNPVLVLQVGLDLATCFLIADLALRLVSPRAARVAFLLAALCPFLANYTAAALTETGEIFFTALALDLALIGIRSFRIGPWAGCGAAIAAAVLLRPDGGILLIAVGLYLVWLWIRPRQISHVGRPAIVRAALLVFVIALAPLVPWTLRNWRTLHQFEPLAPRYAQQDEFVPMGFNHWLKTWIVDYASVEEIDWHMPGAAVKLARLPNRAFDSPAQREETERLFAEYNAILQITPAIDADFARLAAARIHAAPLRYYLTLPLLRIADMWFRPRTEILPADTRWWEFNDDPKWSAVAISFGILGLLYPALAWFGFRRRAMVPGLGLLLVFLIIRSAFLGTLENPEPRYVLECYPIVLAMAGAACAKLIP